MELAEQAHSDPNAEILPSDIRYAAGQSNNQRLAYYLSKQPDMVDASDGSGWRPIHEAARGGNLAGLQLLIDSGSDLNARTGRGGSGGTALWWALQRYGEESDVVRFLRSYDAPEDGPDL
jgi:ankyrin repeat protein